MKNLKTQIESVRDYAYKRLEDGYFDLISVYCNEDIKRVMVVVEIDSCRLNLVMSSDTNKMYQFITDDVILFNNTTKTPARIKELAANNVELEIQRLEEKLNKLKNQ